MPHETKAPKQVDANDVIMAFSKGKNLESDTYRSVKDLRGEVTLYHKPSNQKIAISGSINKRKIMRANLEFEGLQTLKMATGFCQQGNLFNMNWEILKHENLEEEWKKVQASKKLGLEFS